MVQKCVNPACGEPFLYFRNGKIYRIDRREAMPHLQQRQQEGKAEHLWLCGRCSARLGVVLAPDGSVEVTEAHWVPRDPRLRELCFSLTRGDVSTCAMQLYESENSRFVARSHAGVRTPPILVLDVEFKTLGFIEEILHDSGFGAITCTSVVEAINLSGTGFFDVFIVIEHPAQSRAAAMLSVLATARLHCKCCFCWSAENVRQLCNDFIEKAMKWGLHADHGDHDVYNAVLPQGAERVSGQETSAATA